MGRNLKKIISRLIQIVFSVWILFSLTFFLLQIFPGSPFQEEVRLHPTVQERLTEKYGLGKPWGQRYLTFLKNAVTGELGVSWQEPNVTVRSIIQQKAGLSLQLGLLAFTLAFIFSIIVTMIIGHSRWLDSIVLVMISVPGLLIGPFLIWFFGFYLNLLPVALLESAQHWVLPVMVLMMRPLFQLIRILKNSLKAAEASDFARTGRAIGMSVRSLRYRWVLKAAISPFLSQASLIFVSLISGSFLVESLFAIPGLGSQFVESVLNRDYPLVLGLAIFYGTILMFVQLFLDILLSWIDPRVETL